ncbi:MAG: ATP-binding protein [Bacteroidota bacterium]
MKNLSEYVKEGHFYKAVVEDGADIIFIVDYSGNILYHNPSVQDTLGHSPKSLIGKNFFDFIHTDILESFRDSFNRCTEESYTEHIEFRFLCHNGSYKYLDFNSINLKHKDNLEGLILDCRDITQRKKDAEELLRAQKAKEQFLANMSHEIRTPINGIAGMVSLLSETAVSQEQSQYLNAIKNSADNLKVIINDILDLSVIESGKLKFEHIGFNIRSQLTAVIDTFQFQAKEKDIELKYSIENEADLIVLGDPVRLNQVLINLVSNAVKFTHSGEIRVDVKVMSKDDKKIRIRFAVSDTGVGISDEKIESIFDTFTQADESVTRRFGGTGLGLSICKQLVELQNGAMRVESEENVGSTFIFEIPYDLGNDEDLIKSRSFHDSSKSINGKNTFKGLKVLLVEDNDINRLYAASILKKWGCTTETAENGFIALEKLKKNVYHVVFMDIQMPVMDGFEATKNIRNTFAAPKSDIPIIALTANAIKGDNERCFAVGMNDYLSKPFLPEELYDILMKFFKKSKETFPESFKNLEDEKPKQVATKVKTATKSAKHQVIDLTYLKNISNNDDTFMVEMIETFIKNTGSAIEEIKVKLEEEDWNEVGNIAHRIKPSITFMGIESMKPVIKNIEDYSKNEKHLEEVPQLFESFTAAIEVAFKELKEEIGQD